jgi:hypothetical protein
MSDHLGTGRDFEGDLQREVDRVLADPAFQRSPVQTRLLTYLCEQTISHNRNISQIAVAVDGLGRPENADVLTESYPRVQISRLRRNLSLYYSRCAPGDGLAVYIRHGDYHLRLAPPESAYGELRRRGAMAAPANDTAPAPPAPSAGAAPGAASESWKPAPLAAAAVFGAVAVGSLWLAFSSHPGSPTGAPALDVQIDEPAASAPDPLLTLAAQQAEDIASNSYVVRRHRPEDRGAAPGYTVRLERSQSLGAHPVLEVSLIDPANQRLFHDSIPLDEDRAAVLSRLNGALVQMVSPAGAIARRELASFGGEPRNDYQCVLRTEAGRLQGGLSADLVERCLERFPTSPYRAYWYSRLAYTGYRNQVLAGGTVEAAGVPWQNLRKALAADAANPFANYIAGKVYLARGDCEGARPFIQRALENGNFYATLISASVGEASLCTGDLKDDLEGEALIASLVDSIAEPNALLQVSLIFASAAVDRPDLARRVLASPAAADSDDSTAAISGALADGLASPAAFELHRDRLQRVVDGFYWGAEARSKLMDKLKIVAAFRA